MSDISLQELLKAGCHFGHEVKRWHPKASEFIYTERSKIHIIDLTKTKKDLLKAFEFAKKLGKEGKKLLFVGTKRQAKGIIESESQRISAPYFYQRWMGGFITNWNEIKKNIDKLIKMEEDKKSGNWQKFPKHEQLELDRERAQLEKFYGGVKMLKEVPDALFVVDIRKEKTAVSEARKCEIPIIGVVDTNSDPRLVNYPIPANDDSVKSISLITRFIADGYQEGLQEFEKKVKKSKLMSQKSEVQEGEKVTKRKTRVKKTTNKDK